jgi:hypothetical protein
VHAFIGLRAVVARRAPIVASDSEVRDKPCAAGKHRRIAIYAESHNERRRPRIGAPRPFSTPAGRTGRHRRVLGKPQDQSVRGREARARPADGRAASQGSRVPAPYFFAKDDALAEWIMAFGKATAAMRRAARRAARETSR